LARFAAVLETLAVQGSITPLLSAPAAPIIVNDRLRQPSIMTSQRKDPRLDRFVEVSVERVGAQGDGIAYYKGEPVFLPFTVPGDQVRVRLGTRRGGGREGRVVDRRVSGPGRADPPCPHFGTCGGCILQHLDPASYRAVKLGTLTAALERVRIDPSVIEPLRVVPPARRRARIGLVRPRDLRLPPRVGFRRRFSHDLVDVTECLVLEAPLFSVVTELRQIVGNVLPPGGTAEAAITSTDSGVDLLIEAAERPALAALETLAEFAEACDLPRVVWRSPNEEVPVVMRRPVRVVMSGVAVPFPPGGFLQASRVAEQILVEAVLAGIGSRHPVLDLFAGLGTFAFSLARRGPVHAVEGEARAAAALAAAAEGRRQISVERRDLARDPLSSECLSHYAAAVFDPPRAGALRQAQALATSALDTVVGVSCNPATFARDAVQLIAGGFRLERIIPVDQFVWTPHLELVGVFRR
jgi:23S rRNA (uracil1939-C5)-methyltransferase